MTRPRLAVLHPSGPGNGPGDGRRTHACRLPGCRVRVGVSRLMCRPHWHAVPKPVRDRIWAAWRSGAGLFDPAYRQAVTEAVAAIQVTVARKESPP